MGFVRRNAVGLTALFVALGGGAYAASSSLVGPGGVIGGCVPKHGGALIVLRPGKSCPRGTVALSFNQKGQPGRNGVTGPAGTVVLTRSRSTAATQSITVIGGAGCFTVSNCPDPSHGAPVPLTGAGWSQSANQINEFFFKVVVSAPPSSRCGVMSGIPPTGFSGPGTLLGQIDDSATATPLGTFIATAGSTSTVTQVTVPVVSSSQFEPGTRLNHALTVRIADNCGANGGASGGHFTLERFAMDAVGIS